MKRRALVGGLALMILAVGAFDGYAWWTRRAAPSFSQGGAFGSSPTPTPSGGAITAQGRSRPRADARAVAPSLGATQASPRASASAAPARVSVPAEGLYVYEGHGEERVTFGGAGACAWEIDDVTIDVKHEGDDVVQDQTVSENHQQRGIYTYRRDGVFQSYFGAAVTCVGVRRTEESDYAPPTLRFALPFEVGRTWRSASRTNGWTETVNGRVLRTESITVPAGRFHTYVVAIDATFSDGQSGRFQATLWFAPSVGLWVKEDVDAEVENSGARFRSEYGIELARAPDA